MNEVIRKYDDVIKMLDKLIAEETNINWDHFYTNRDRKVPFFVEVPDENLVDYMDKGLITSGKVLELGCGPGRNAMYLAEKGCSVDAVDMSEVALQWGRERAKEKGINVNYIKKDLFELELEKGVYDLVYDSGCFHHIAPHRRMDYIDLVFSSLKAGGYFALTCFEEGGVLGGATISDLDVYIERSLQGGLGFTPKKLKKIFYDFEEIEIRKMKKVEDNAALFGVEGLWVALFKKAL